MKRLLLLALFSLAPLAVHAQEYAGGPPAPAKYELRGSAAFPQGVGVSAAARLFRGISLELGVGLLPIAYTESAALNLHVAPSHELDPAITIMHTFMVRRGENIQSTSLMYGFLASRKTGLHSYGRAGISALTIGSKMYPALSFELGLSYGFR
jgi:hypothetical protein